MTIRNLMLLTLLALGGCASAPEPAAVADIAVPEFCKTAHEAGPSYSQADLEARIAERKAALPEGAPVTSLTPIVRYGPQFPRCALSYNIEGYCDMVFDVTADGKTANILPVCSSRIFEREAAYTVGRWTFEPPGEGPRPAVLNRIVFKIEDTYTAPAPPAEPGPATE